MPNAPGRRPEPPNPSPGPHNLRVRAAMMTRFTIKVAFTVK
jgi:hypothetical protein